ncbi:MAG: glycosyltransferase family 4 protein [Nanoarchaeota archaeon]|nr:glycosyltransferase family 4 protein [Nanoarchaeota archaeon]
MKILFICENYYPQYGGAEVLFKNLAEGYVQRGQQVTVLTHRLKGTAKKEILNGVVIRRINSFFSRYAFTFSSIITAVQLARKHDIIQTTTFNGAPPAWIAGKLAGKPVVLTIHEVWQGKWKEITGFSWLKSKLHELLERFIYLLPYHRYICVSEATKKDLLRLNIKPNKVERIYNGLDYTFWDPKKVEKRPLAELRKQLGLEGKFVSFSWGRPGESKGFEYVIRAASAIAKEMPHAVLLLLFGATEKYNKKHQQLLALIQGHPNIKVIPSAPYDQLRNYVALADCVIVPSLSEGFGYSAVEASALGKPLLISDAGALPEVVSGKYRVFQRGNSDDLAKNFFALARGKHHAIPLKRFTWEDCISQYLEHYQQLLSRAE